MYIAETNKARNSFHTFHLISLYLNINVPKVDSVKTMRNNIKPLPHCRDELRARQNSTVFPQTHNNSK